MSNEAESTNPIEQVNPSEAHLHHNADVTSTSIVEPIETNACQKCASHSSDAWIEVNSEIYCATCVATLISQDQPDQQWTDIGKRCSQCAAISSSIWRKGPLGIGSLCNECGLKWTPQQQQSQQEERAAEMSLESKTIQEVQETQSPLAEPPVHDSNKEEEEEEEKNPTAPLDSATNGKATPLPGRRRRERIRGDGTPGSATRSEKRGRGRPRGTGQSKTSTSPSTSQRRGSQSQKNNDDQLDPDKEKDTGKEQGQQEKEERRRKSRKEQEPENHTTTVHQEMEQRGKESDESDVMRDDEELKAMEAGRRRVQDKRKREDDVYEFQSGSHQDDNYNSSSEKKKKSGLMYFVPMKRRRYQKRQDGLLPVPAPVNIQLLGSLMKKFGSNGSSLDKLRSPIDALTNQHLLHIFSFLDARLLCRCMRVCTNWRDNAKNQTLWRDLYDRKWPINYQNLCKYLGQIEWRRLYRARAKLRLFSDMEQSEYMCKFYIIENNPKILECILDKVEQELALWLTAQKQNNNNNSSSSNGIPSITSPDQASVDHMNTPDDPEKQKKKALLLSLNLLHQRKKSKK